MADLSALLIDAAAKGRAARDEAWAALSQPPPVPTDAEVEAVLATLPAKAVRALAEDPEREVFALMDGITKQTAPLANAVAAALRAGGASASVGMDPNSDRCGGQWLAVNISSLLAAGDAAAERQALAAFEAAWSTLTDGAGSAMANHAAATLIASAPAGSYTLAPGWQKRPTGDIVEEARQALRLPLWRLADVAEGWTAAVAASGAYGAATAYVDMMPGYHVGALYRDVPALVLRAGESATVALDRADIVDMTSAEVVALASARLGLTTDDDGPDSAPAAQPTLPAIAAQPERHLTRSERKALRRQAHA